MLEIPIYGYSIEKSNLIAPFIHIRIIDELSCEHFLKKAHFSGVKTLMKTLCEKLFNPVKKFFYTTLWAPFKLKKYNHLIKEI